MIYQKKIHVRDVARIFKVSERTIYRMVNNKGFAMHDLSRKNFVTMESVMKYIELDTENINIL